MITDIIIDIETSAHVTCAMREYMEADIKPRANIKDEAKIAADLEKKRLGIYEKAAFSPLTGRVAVIGYIAISDDGSEKKEVLTTQDSSERELLTLMSDVMTSLDPRRIVTFNGRRFDLPFLVSRSIILGICGYQWPLGHHPAHIDICDYLDGSLEAWSVAIRNTRKEAPSSDVPALIAAGEWDVVIRHCADDITLTMDLYNKLRAVAAIR